MRPRRFVQLALMATACSSGGAGDHAPALSAYFLDPTVVPQDRGMSGSLVFEDPDGDVAAVEFTLSNRRTGAAETHSVQVPDANGVPAGTLSLQLNPATLAPAPYTLAATLVDAGGARSATLSCDFLLYGGFGPASAYPLAQSYTSVGDTAVGDLDGDGRNDVAAMEFSGLASRVFVFHQTAQGALASPPDVIATGLQLRGIAVGDVTGDGRADLVASGIPQSASPGVVIVYAQDAIGGLAPPVAWPVPFAGGVALADLDGDGRTEVVVAGLDGIAVLFQDATGALAAPVVVAPGLGAIGFEVHVGDMDGDGRLDIVVQAGMKQMAVVRQIAPRTFAATPDVYEVLTSYWPQANAFAVGDVNGDGRTDLVVTDPGNGGYLNLFLQTSGGTLAGPIAYRPGFDMPAGIEIADVDGDGLADLVFDAGGMTVTVAHQGPDHRFTDVYTYAIPTISFGGTMVRQALSVADVTGDGQPDLVVSWMDEGVFVVPHL